MKIAKLKIEGQPRWAEWRHGQYFLLNHDLDGWLSGADELGSGGDAVEGKLLVPLDSQEVWASGVTYRRSREAREHESQVADVYERVYAAERPELFFKATASRAAHPGEAVGIREDARWNVPEPELALVLNAKGEIVGLHHRQRHVQPRHRGREPAVSAAGQGVRPLPGTGTTPDHSR